MAQENFFNYGEKIQSSRMGQALGTISGVGPLSGFGSAKIEGTTLQVYPYATGDALSADNSANQADPLRYIIRSRVESRNIPQSDGQQPMFSLVARDGTIYRSPLQSNGCISVPIEGSVSTEVFLFAVHQPITEAVENLVTFKAYFNNSSTDFYTKFKKARDPYYPSTDDDLVGTITEVDEKDPFLTKDSTFTALEEAVKNACPEFLANQKAWVLIGVYGNGVDLTNSNQSENFAIVPYQGQGISELPYSYGIHAYLTKALNRVETFLFENIPTDSSGNKYTNLVDLISALIDSSLSDIETRVSNCEDTVKNNILPSGSIMLWEGDQVPDGWEEYSKANGRIVIGYTSGGIETVQGKKLATLGDTYEPVTADGIYTSVVKGSDLPQHRHGIGVKCGRHDNASDAYGLLPCQWTEKDTTLNGTCPDSKYNAGITILKGAVMGSYNLNDGTDPTSEVTNTQMTLDKLIPAITLRYIRKSSSYNAITAADSSSNS